MMSGQHSNRRHLPYLFPFFPSPSLSFSSSQVLDSISSPFNNDFLENFSLLHPYLKRLHITFAIFQSKMQYLSTLFLAFSAISTTLVSAAPVGSTLDDDTLLKNGQEAQRLNTLFQSINTTDACTSSLISLYHCSTTTANLMRS